MKPHAFVVMPFRTKAVRRRDGTGTTVDFDAVYHELLGPALAAAGFDALRAAEEQRSGDVRTDMYFELVTADLVVADVSTPNANVFYEIGVRHGVAERGIVLVHGRFEDAPFDTVVDRRFAYDGSLFDTALTLEPGERAARLEAEVRTLASLLQGVVAADREQVSSPVYKELPGLVPADWRGLRTARMAAMGRQFEAWSHLIDRARGAERAGDVVVLAEEAPNRFFERQALRAAADCLHDLGRFEPALRLYRRLLADDPDDVEVRAAAGRALLRLGHTDEAATEIHRALRDAPTDGEAQGGLGRLYKDLWRARWRAGADVDARREAARLDAAFGQHALACYRRAYRANLADVYLGVNVLALARMLALVGAAPADEPPDPASTTTLVALALEVTAADGVAGADDVWRLATRGEAALLGGDTAGAVRAYQQAVAMVGVSPFQLSSMHSQLTDYVLLGIEEASAVACLEVVARHLVPPRTPHLVVVGGGHRIDEDDRPEARFPASREPGVRAAVDARLDALGLGPGDLALCGGANGADIVFAEACLARGATVELLLSRPVGEYVRSSVRPAGASWEHRFRTLANDPAVTVADQLDRLGPVPDGVNRYARTNRWMIAHALAVAPAASVRVLAVWDGDPDGDGPGGTADLVAAADAENLWLETIDPRDVP